MKRNFKFSYVLLFFIATGIAAMSACSTNPGDMDAVPPTVSVDSPTNGQVVGNVYTMTGIAADTGSGVAAVQIVLDASSVQSVVPVNGAWSATITVPSVGGHTNTVYAVDNNGNRSEELHIAVTADNIPYVAVSTPTNRQTVLGRNVVVSGTASVFAPYSVSLVQVKVNDGAWTGASGTASWTAEVTLANGPNTITARAIADNGRIALSGSIEIICGTAVYVSSTGNNTNDGLSPATPKATLESALSLGIYDFDAIIYVSGNLALTTNATSMNSGWRISGADDLLVSGGWNADFTAQGAPSVLNAGGVCKHVVYLSDCANVTLTNFVVTGGRAATDSGGGVYMYHCSDCTLACVVSNNFAKLDGGGVYISGGVSNFIYGLIACNVATNNGGGMYVIGCNNNIFDCTVSNNSTSFPSSFPNGAGGGIWLSGNRNTFMGKVLFNKAYFFGGGIYITNGQRNYISNYIYGNFVQTMFGGGVCLEDSVSNRVSGIISSNSMAYQGGGGVWIWRGGWNTVSGVVSNNYINTADYGGVGVGIFASDRNVISANVTGNHGGGSSIGGGGIIIINSYNNTISGSVSSNSISCMMFGGGGIKIHESYYTTVSGDVFGNYTYGNGGGVYATGYNNLIEGNIYGNTASEFGGGLFIRGVTNTVSGDIFDNKVLNECGGGITVMCADSLFSGNIYNNTAIKIGGGVHITEYNNSFTGNIYGNTSANGGGIGCEGGRMNIFSGLISDNAVSSNGGGIYINFSSHSNTIASNAVIRYNHCDNDNDGNGEGGGVYVASGALSNVIQSGAVWSPNFERSGTSITNDLYGITAP